MLWFGERNLNIFSDGLLILQNKFTLERANQCWNLGQIVSDATKIFRLTYRMLVSVLTNALTVLNVLQTWFMMSAQQWWWIRSAPLD